MSNIKECGINDYLSFKDMSHKEKHGLRGHVQIFRENKETKEKTLWYEADNIIPISGYQFVLMKMFGLYLDSQHHLDYEDISRDTNLVIPDLNNSGAYKLGIDPEKYSVMSSNISSDHFIQGFMIGNGGSGEDSITTKNTDYSFIKLRNPIPFQQTQTQLPSSIAGKYLGMLRMSPSSMSKSYYIKKFDGTPHIYHSWWKEGQRWEYVDPVTQNDLGPDAVNGVGKTKRIETYVECKLSLDEDDCIAYFNHEGSTQTGVINELGLVAFDTKHGERYYVEELHNDCIKKALEIIYSKDRTLDTRTQLRHLLYDIYLVYENQLRSNHPDECKHPNIEAFFQTMLELRNESSLTSPEDNIDWEKYQEELSSESNINVEAYYNKDGKVVYTEDKYLEYLGDDVFLPLTTDEAQRIKLATYYTFKPIPLSSNWKILINYRIYAN